MYVCMYMYMYITRKGGGGGEGSIGGNAVTVFTCYNTKEPVNSMLSWAFIDSSIQLICVDLTPQVPILEHTLKHHSLYM